MTGTTAHGAARVIETGFSSTMTTGQLRLLWVLMIALIIQVAAMVMVVLGG